MVISFHKGYQRWEETETKWTHSIRSVDRRTVRQNATSTQSEERSEQPENIRFGERNKLIKGTNRSAKLIYSFNKSNNPLKELNITEHEDV